MTYPHNVGRCGNTWHTIKHLPPLLCTLPAGHDGWHRDDDSNGTEWNHADESLPLILAAVDNALRNGSYMTGANLAFDMLCDRLNVNRDRLVFQPGWATSVRDTTLPITPSAGATTNRPR